MDFKYFVGLGCDPLAVDVVVGVVFHEVLQCFIWLFTHSFRMLTSTNVESKKISRRCFQECASCAHKIKASRSSTTKLTFLPTGRHTLVCTWPNGKSVKTGALI